MAKKNAFITPDFFSVARELIGRPLATPSRRALAMAIDGILVAILVQAGGVFLGLAAVFALLRASRRSEKTGYVRTSVRFALRSVAAIVLFVVALEAWDFGEEKINEQIPAETPQRDAATDPQGLATAANLAGLADEPGEVATGPAPVSADSAPSQKDSLEAVIADLRSDVKRLDDRGHALAAELEEARERRGLRNYISGLFDDLGLGFGWAAVYFTAFLAMMHGQTPGKKLVGIRVIRLDGKPLGWWIAFERFGGYAASFSVGLLGFLQILWDRNRQGLHDKACETVVVREIAQTAARS